LSARASAKTRAHAVFARVAEAEQVEVARPPVRFAGPQREEGRSLQHEPPGVRRRRGSEEESLVGVAREQALEVLASLAGQPQQASAHRGADVLDRRLPHASASRYGRMNA
jgi:hypothetical protein